jgi:hypothetical protein
MENREIAFDDVVKNFKNFISYQFKYKMLWIVVIVIGITLGITIAIFSKTKFEAKISFIINDGKSSSQNPLAALASQFSLNSSPMNITDERILFLIGTKKILGQSLLTKYPNTKFTLADKYIEIMSLKKVWSSDTSLSSFNTFTNKNIEKLSYHENKAMDIVLALILKSNDLQYETVKKKSSSLVSQSSSGIVLISFKSKDELLSKTFVETIYKNLSSFYIETITQNLLANYELVSNRADSIKTAMFSSESEAAEAMDQSIGVFKFRGKIKSNRLKRDNEILNLMYAEVIKNKEIAKFNLDQEKPILQVIDEPTLPLEQHIKSKIIYGIVGALIGGTLLFFSLTIFYLKGLKR